MEKYTAFEVFITDKEISAGMVDSNDRSDTNSVANLFDFDNTTATGLTYLSAVPPIPDMKVQIELKAEAIGGKGVSVDWGDGTEENPNIQSYADCYDGSKYVTHRYVKLSTDSETSQTVEVNNPGKFVIKVYGNIASFRPAYSASAKTNPISRVWEMDLPIADSCWNLYGLCRCSYRLLRVQVPDYNYVWPTCSLKLSYAFHTCSNLQSFKMGKNDLPRILQMDYMFHACHNVKTIIWDPEGLGKFPETQQTAWNYMYYNCEKLTTKLVDLLPVKRGWTMKEIDGAAMFGNDISIPAPTDDELEKIAAVLWDSDVRFSWIHGYFSGCSDTLRAKIPTTWGGTKEIETPTYKMNIKL